MNSILEAAALPRVRIVGEVDHTDFAEALELLRAGAQVVTTPDSRPELIVVMQSRPGLICDATIESLRRGAPLAGIVALLGTWCEGETRTGRPWPGVQRLYWYEFPAWWQRQLALRAAGRCPDWARADDIAPASRVVPDPGRGRGGHPAHGSAGCRVAGSLPTYNCTNGLVVISTPVRDTAATLADVLQQAGYATLWQPPRRPAPVVRGAVAGIWDGGQLSKHEENSLSEFCTRLARDAAPVIALLDFPRRDRCERARRVGAVTVLGKPWPNVNLMETVKELTVDRARDNEPTITRAA
jgi:hypothetical protein